MELYRETVEMWDVMEACRQLIAGRAEDAGLVVTVVWHDPGPLTLQADPTKIKQVLLNLLSNAIKFTPRGRQDHHIHRVSSRSMDKTVGCRYRHRHDARLIWWSRWSRSGRSKTRIPASYQGTGLGLPLVKALVELHGGEFRIETQPGIGTKATVVLPTHAMAFAAA